MMIRHEGSGVGSGAMVFPGGKVDPADSALREYCTSRDLDEPALTLRIAAIRETYEECGLLLGRTAGSDAYLSGEAVAAFHVRDGSAEAFAAAVAASPIQLATQDLVPLAHWITPAGAHKRFDTHFFVTAVPTDQVAQADGHEAVEVVWTTPVAATAAADAGSRYLMFPTYMNLRKLRHYTSVAAVLEAARANPVFTVRPDITKKDTGLYVRLPVEAGYDMGKLPPGYFRAE